MPMVARQCLATRRGGARCEAFAVNGSEYCLTHSRDRVRQRAERNRKGGRAHAIPKVAGSAVTVEKIADVLRGLNAVILDSWELENSAPRSRVLIAAYDETIKAMQSGDFESRIAALESRFANEPTKKQS